MRITTQTDRQPEFRALIKQGTGVGLDEMILDPLMPNGKRQTLHVDTRVFAQMALNQLYTVYPKNYPRSFFQVTRLSWELFAFDCVKASPTLLLEKCIVQFNFPKPRAFYRAIDPELAQVQLGTPYAAVQILLTCEADWDRIQERFKCKTDFDDSPHTYPCIAVVFSVGENNPAGVTFVYPQATPEIPNPTSVADIFAMFRISLAEKFGIPHPESALLGEILAKVAFTVGKFKNLSEMLPNPGTKNETLWDAFHSFRIQIAQLLQLPDPQHALPDEILLRADTLIRFVEQRGGINITP